MAALLHVALNLLMLVWCGTKVERILGPGRLVVLYVVGAYTAAVAQWLVVAAVADSDDRSERRDQRGDRRLRAELRPAEAARQLTEPQPLAQRAVAARRLGRACS